MLCTRVKRNLDVTCVSCYLTVSPQKYTDGSAGSPVLRVSCDTFSGDGRTYDELVPGLSENHE